MDVAPSALAAGAELSMAMLNRPKTMLLKLQVWQWRRLDWERLREECDRFMTKLKALLCPGYVFLNYAAAF